MAAAVAETPVDPGQALIEKYEFPDDPGEAGLDPVVAPVADVVETPAEPARPKHPLYLSREAKKLGLEDAEIAEMATAELKDAVQTLAQVRGVDRVADQARQRDETGRFVKQPEPEPVPEAEFSLKDLGLDLTKLPENPTTEDILTAFGKPLMAEMRKLKAELTEFKERDVQRERTAQFDKLDQLFVKNEAVFGKGTRQALKPGSPEFLRRVAVINGMAAAKQQNPNASFDEQFEAVSSALFGGLVPEPVSEPADRLNYTNGHTIRPTSRATKPEPKGIKTAERAVEAIIKERGINLGGPENTEHDDLPD